MRNANDTYDVGPMQFNTAYLSGLAKYGIRPEHVAQSGCYSYVLAAWRIHMHIRNDRGDLWTKVANYHSYTPHLNACLPGRPDAKGSQVGKMAQFPFCYPGCNLLALQAIAMWMIGTACRPAALRLAHGQPCWIT